MAAQNGQPNTNNASGGPDAVTQVSSMPLPPMHYVNEYTDEAIRRGTAPLPPPPILDTYSMFGQPFSSEDCIVASLESQGIRRLYSAKEVDRKRELRKLNHSALVNFLDLLDILIKVSSSFSLD
jgi:mediator of RNA polymerase II transcription subunit 7